MKTQVLRWFLLIAALAVMALTVSSPSSLADAPRAIAPEMDAIGTPLLKNGWISDSEYRDDSIHFTVNAKRRKPKSSSAQITCRWVIIEIAHPSQIRTMFSGGSYESRQQERSNKMAKRVNAAVALNADFAKYTYDFGYVIRQGVFYRDALSSQKVPRDVLVIDDRGDFTVVRDASTESMRQCLDALQADGRTAMNTFTFGPALIVDGEVQEINLSGEHEARLAVQRICICQLGPLKYAVVEIDGGNGTGMNLQELANFIPEILPECRVAYNLDGGGSTHLLVDGKLIHPVANSRAISDIIYFASSLGE